MPNASPRGLRFGTPRYCTIDTYEYEYYVYEYCSAGIQVFSFGPCCEPAASECTDAV